jgi:non-ribosomal peptide synthetase component F
LLYEEGMEVLMPEGPEIETDKLHEAIQEEMEKEGGNFLKRIALSTAILAAFAAIAALKAGATVNEALLLKTESTRLQAQASDQWAYYQAKGLKAAVQEATAASWEAAGKPIPEKLHAQSRRYAEEQAEIKKSAEEKEKERDEKSAEADHLLHHHHLFANAVALFQVSIALGALAALTRSRAVWWGSMVLGLSGIPLFILAFFA